MAERKTKTEIEIESLRENIARLNAEKSNRLMVWTKTLYGMGLILLASVAIIVGSWLGWSQPPFWLVLGVGGLYAIIFLVQVAMLLRHNFKINAEISAKKAKLNAAVSMAKK